MRYNVYFSRINDEKLRKMLVGDGATEGVTGITHIPRWQFDAVRNIAREEDKRMSQVFADAVREYVLRRGFRRPRMVYDDEVRADAEAANGGDCRDSLFLRIYDALHADGNGKRKRQPK